ncbi:MAG: PaaI family thioesterase [Acidimicrobiia bacterium]|nr:PaaI family thioesterase [Acidimicrobiia bacterium]
MDLTPQRVNDLVATAFPATTAMGFACVELGDGSAVARLTCDPSEARPGGIVPGPTVFGLADLALWFAVFTKIGFEPMAVTSDMTIHFLRPAMADSLLARCNLTKVGKRLAHGEIRVWEEDGDPERLIAFASGAYALPDAKGDAST